MEPLLTYAQAAERLAITERKLRSMVANGYIPIIKIGVERRFDPEDVAAYIADHKHSKENRFD